MTRVPATMECESALESMKPFMKMLVPGLLLIVTMQSSRREGPGRLGTSTLVLIVAALPPATRRNHLLTSARDIFSERVFINLEWEEGGFTRILNLDRFVDPFLDTPRVAAWALSLIWAQAPGFLPVIFTTGFDFSVTAYGGTPVVEDATFAARGSFITKRGLKNVPDLVVAHELVHSIGKVGDKFCAGAFGLPDGQWSLWL